MKKITLFGCILVATLVVISTFPSVVSEGNTIYVDDDGGADYANIQDAVDAASDGDTIFVFNGTVGCFFVKNLFIDIRNSSIAAAICRSAASILEPLSGKSCIALRY